MSSKLLIWLLLPRGIPRRTKLVNQNCPKVGRLVLHVDPNDPEDAEMRARWQAKRDAYDDQPSSLD